MKIELQSTTQIVDLNGIPARIWTGKTDTGIKVHAFITRIAIDKTEPNTEQFERELQEHEPPRPDIAVAYPSRMIL